MPPVLFIAIFVMTDDKKMATVTTEQTYKAYHLDPIGYEMKRVRRFNQRSVKNVRRPHVARGFCVERYIAAPSPVQSLQRLGYGS